MKKLKRVYVYEETKERIEQWANERKAELPYIYRPTFPQLIELYTKMEVQK